MVGVGNHDMFYDAVAYESRFRMPQSATLGSQGNMWYAFDYGNSHWVRPIFHPTLTPLNICIVLSVCLWVRSR